VKLVFQKSRRALIAVGSMALAAVLSNSASAQKNDWLIVPGHRVGPITAATTRADLDSLFGKENVREQGPDTSDLPEPATVAYGNDPSGALAVTWNKERASTIHVCFATHMGPCKWRTASGIRIGLPLRELEKLNGKSFQLAGYGSDGQVIVTSWRNGSLEEDPAACGHLEVRLSPAAGLEDRPLSKQQLNLMKQVVVGKPYSSGNLSIVELNPVVSALELQFVGPGCAPK
jgi:hypothetical protein